MRQSQAGQAVVKLFPVPRLSLHLLFVSHPQPTHPQHTCQHLQLSHQLLVTAVSSMIRLLQMLDAEVAINHEAVAPAVLVGLVAAPSGHQDLLILPSPDHV